ncbi:MAG: type II toxin-antitoxin system HicB family antitoxin [Alphaproteobacteria bacterium]|nr:type II toxin-antitoxin system HicB family antitoxin [Alphaproteobacteria bacterium]
MSNMMEYKGFTALIEYSSEDDEFVGHVVNASPDRITFGGKDVKQLKKHMKEIVDAYIEWAKEEGIDPQKPFNGRITYRTTPQHHAQIAKAAAFAGKRSLNAFIDEAVMAQAAKILENHHKA